MGKVNGKRGPVEDKRPRSERRNSERRLGLQVRRAERKSLTPFQRLIFLMSIGR